MFPWQVRIPLLVLPFFLFSDTVPLYRLPSKNGLHQLRLASTLGLCHLCKMMRTKRVLVWASLCALWVVGTASALESVEVMSDAKPGMRMFCWLRSAQVACKPRRLKERSYAPSWSCSSLTSNCRLRNAWPGQGDTQNRWPGRWTRPQYLK